MEDISAYIKSIDPNHLVLLGHSGTFGASTPDLCVPPHCLAFPYAPQLWCL